MITKKDINIIPNKMQKYRENTIQHYGDKIKLNDSYSISSPFYNIAYIINEDGTTGDDIHNISNSQYIKAHNQNEFNEIFTNNELFEFEDVDVSLNKTQKFFRK